MFRYHVFVTMDITSLKRQTACSQQLYQDRPQSVVPNNKNTARQYRQSVTNSSRSVTTCATDLKIRLVSLGRDNFIIDNFRQKENQCPEIGKCIVKYIQKKKTRCISLRLLSQTRDNTVS
jgi:hypothetical protein